MEVILKYSVFKLACDYDFNLLSVKSIHVARLGYYDKF